MSEDPKRGELIPRADLLPYARDTWEAIVRDARRAARDQAAIAAYASVIFTLVLGVIVAALVSSGGLAKLVGLLAVPALLVIPIALAGLTYLGAHRLTIERRCRKAWICDRCGYDLRASEGRCPECGKRFLPKPSNPPPA